VTEAQRPAEKVGEEPPPPVPVGRPKPSSSVVSPPLAGVVTGKLSDTTATAVYLS